MRKIFCVICVTFLAFSAAETRAVAEPKTIIYSRGETPMYSVEFDDNWDVEQRKGKMIGESRDGKVSVWIGELKKTVVNFEAASVAVQIALQSNFAKVYMAREEAGLNLNGMIGAIYEGSLVDAGNERSYLVVLFAVRRGEVGGLVFIVDPLAERSHYDEIRKVALSVRPL